MNIEDRRAQLDTLSRFVTNANEYVDNLLADIGWNKGDLMKPTRIQKQEQEQTNKECDKDTFPESFYDEHRPFSVKFDKYSQATVVACVNNMNYPIDTVPCPNKELSLRAVPSSHKDLITNFTRDERLALYQHVIDKTPTIEPLPEITISFKKKYKDAKMTPLAEIAAYRRDIRRRNQKYRVAKNPLTYQEEIKNLIQLQTEALSEYLGHPKKDSKSHSSCRDSDGRTEEENTHRKREKKNKRKRSRSRSKSRSRRQSSKSKSRKRARSNDRGSHDRSKKKKHSSKHKKD